jgi:hypothetical protein
MTAGAVYTGTVYTGTVYTGTVHVPICTPGSECNLTRTTFAASFSRRRVSALCCSVRANPLL